MKDIELQTEAFKRYIEECDELSITPDYAGAFNAAWIARAAVEADRAQRVPDGWKLVPVEPTEEMLCAGDDVLREAFRDRCIATQTIYDAMLASTPAQPAQQEQVAWHSPDDTERVPKLVWLREKGSIFLGYHFEQPFREYRDSDGFYVGQQDDESYWARYEDGEPCEPDGWIPLSAPLEPLTPAQPSTDTLYLLRRLLSNQHTLTGPEFREELTKIVETASTPQPVELKPLGYVPISAIEDVALDGYLPVYKDHGIRE